MKNFDDKLKKYLTVYKIPIAPNSLDPTLFYFPETGEPPKLLPGVHAQILNDLNFFVSDHPTVLEKIVLVGSCLQPGLTNKSADLKVLLILNKKLLSLDIDGILAEEILKLANTLSGKLASTSLHKIQYIPTIRTLEEVSKTYSAIYDLYTSSWSKLPSGLKH
jgi:hypothetical protein